MCDGLDVVRPDVFRILDHARLLIRLRLVRHPVCLVDNFDIVPNANVFVPIIWDVLGNLFATLSI